MRTLSVKMAGTPANEYRVIPNVQDFDFHESGVLIVTAEDGERMFFSPSHWVGANLSTDK